MGVLRRGAELGRGEGAAQGEPTCSGMTKERRGAAAGEGAGGTGEQGLG
jgi:hypothetical protein